MLGAAGILLLGFVLCVWTPARFAIELGATLPSIGMRGPLAVLELLAHGGIAAASAAAGWALWTGRPPARPLARFALMASAAQTVQALYWSVLPQQTPPGSELPLASLALAHAALWLIFLSRSARVRALAGEPERVT
jgi:hypothetical protein